MDENDESVMNINFQYLSHTTCLMYLPTIVYIYRYAQEQYHEIHL